MAESKYVRLNSLIKLLETQRRKNKLIEYQLSNIGQQV